MIGVSRKSYDMGLSTTVYNRRDKSVMPEPTGLGEDAIWGGGPFPLEEDPVFRERSWLRHFNHRRSGFIRFRYSRINFENLR